MTFTHLEHTSLYDIEFQNIYAEYVLSVKSTKLDVRDCDFVYDEEHFMIEMKDRVFANLDDNQRQIKL